MNLITFCDNESLLSKKDKKILKEKNNFFVGDWCTQHDNMFSFKNQKKVLDLFKWGKTKEMENISLDKPAIEAKPKTKGLLAKPEETK